MLPEEPDSPTQFGSPMPSVPPELKVKVPAPLITFVPQLSVPLLLTVKFWPVPTLRPLFKVSDAPELTVKLMFAGLMVPADCVNVLLTPVKLSASPPAPEQRKAPPVSLQEPPRLMVAAVVPLLA